jgi:hypothetical protein
MVAGSVRINFGLNRIVMGDNDRRVKSSHLPQRL